MMSDVCNSILGQAKNGIKLRKYWFSSSSKTRLILQWMVFPLSFCVCKVPNFPIPKNLQLFCELLSNPKLPIPFELLLRVTPWHARLAHYVPTALSDFERRLPLVDFQSHKHYSEGLPSFLEWKFVNRRIDYSHKAVRACEQSSIPHHATAFYSWVVWENHRHPVTAHQIVLRLTIFSDRSPPANENEKLVGMWSHAALILELRHACDATLKSATSAFSNFPRIFLFSITGAVSSWFSDPGFQSKLRSSLVLQ